jgi:MFS family permease
VLRRPSIDTTLYRVYGRNLALDLVAAVGVGVTASIIGSLLPTIARQGGLEPLGLAALGAAPFVANLLSAFAGRVGPRSQRGLTMLRALGSVALVLVWVTPVAAVMIVVATVYWLSLSFGGPLHLRLWGVMYPARMRGRAMGFAGMSKAAAMAIAVVAGGIVADRIGGPPVVAIAGVIGTLCAIAYAFFHAEGAGVPAAFSPREAVRALRDRPSLARLALAQGFYGGGLIAAAPLFALVHVDRLGLSLAEVGLIGILTAGSTMIAFPVWGAVTDRRGGLLPMRIGGSLGIVALAAYALAPDLLVLLVAAVMFGISSASIDIGINSIISEQTSLATRSAALAGWNALTGIRGIAAAFTMSTLVQIGIVNVPVALLICAAISAIGVGLFVRTKMGVPVESRAWEIAPPPRRPARANAAG